MKQRCVWGMGWSLFSWVFIICGQIKVTDIKVLDRKKYGFLRDCAGGKNAQ